MAVSGPRYLGSGFAEDHQEANMDNSTLLFTRRLHKVFLPGPQLSYIEVRNRGASLSAEAT